MGKFMRKRRRADIAVLEGCSGVRTSNSSSTSSRLMARNGACKSGGSISTKKDEELRDPRPEQSDQENLQLEQQEQQQEQRLDVDLSSVQESFPDHDEREEDDEEEDDEAAEDERRAKRSNSSSHLRVSHSDSCLRNRNVAPAIGAAHSRSNSATFSHDQADHLQELYVEDRELAAAAIDLHSTSLDARTIEASCCCGDNTLVLFTDNKESSQASSVSGVEISPPGAAAASGNEKKLPQQPSSGSRFITSSRPRSAADCGPAWRHRVAATAPSCDEIEEFFARVEAIDDSSSKRFVDKYNFDVFNDVPLSGRFEWVQFHSRCS